MDEAVDEEDSLRFRSSRESAPSWLGSTLIWERTEQKGREGKEERGESGYGKRGGISILKSIMQQKGSYMSVSSWHGLNIKLFIAEGKEGVDRRAKTSENILFLPVSEQAQHEHGCMLTQDTLSKREK